MAIASVFSRISNFIGAMQPANKRNMDCGEPNEEKRQKPDERACQYCERTFRKEVDRDDHVNSVHKCSTCYDVVLTDGMRAIHNSRHQQEAQLEQLELQQQHQKDDDFVLCYVKANELHEYRPSSEYEPDFDYIFANHHFNQYELLQIVSKFKSEFLDSMFALQNFGNIQCADLIHLVDNGALPIDDLANVVHSLLYEIHDEDFVFKLISYLLEKDCEIKAEWIAETIYNDELIERIKQKHTFTFEDVYEAGEGSPIWALWSDDQKEAFRIQVNRHFPKRNFLQTNHIQTSRRSHQ